jgi:hypothetical protein
MLDSCDYAISSEMRFNRVSEGLLFNVNISVDDVCFENYIVPDH